MHALKCAACRSRHSPDIDGMGRAIECCHDLGEIDRDDVPICAIDLKPSPEERAATAYSDRQLCFLQAVHNAQQLRYTDLEYDITTDSMLRLHEYVGIDDAAVDELVGDVIVRHESDHPHRLYSVTADGRELLGENYRSGLDYGDGEGGLGESSQHVCAVEIARRSLEANCVDDPDSPIVEIQPYYDIDDGRRLDIAGLDAEGGIELTLEVERANHDLREGTPADYDKMAACEPEHAVWVAMARDEGHEILTALDDPADGDPRIENTYSASTPLRQVDIETPGLTDVYPVKRMRDAIDGDVDLGLFED